MHRKAVVVSATLVFLASLALIAAPGYPAHAGQAASSASAAPKVITVLIRGFKFEPATVTINEGDTVEWKNEDDVPHTATVDDNAGFDSGNIETGAAWRYVAQKKGSYDYICTLHPNMHAKLIVQ